MHFPILFFLYLRKYKKKWSILSFYTQDTQQQKTLVYWGNEKKARSSSSLHNNHVYFIVCDCECTVAGTEQIFSFTNHKNKKKIFKNISENSSVLWHITFFLCLRFFLQKWDEKKLSKHSFSKRKWEGSIV